MKLKEALKELDNEAFNINYNFNKAQWELVIFNQDFDILEEYESKYLKDLLQSYLKKETVEFNHSNEPYIIEDRNRKVEINFGNTEDEENTFQIIFDVFGNLDTEIKDLKDLVKRLENINQEFRDLEMSASERLYPARAYL